MGMGEGKIMRLQRIMASTYVFVRYLSIFYLSVTLVTFFIKCTENTVVKKVVIMFTETISRK